MVSLCVSLKFELHTAAEKGDVAAVNRLIKPGKDVNEKDNVSDGYKHSLLPTYITGSL